MRFVILVVFVIFSAAASAGPIWNYELRGEVSQLGDTNIYGEKVELGDEFSLEISIRNLGNGILDVRGGGQVGDQDLATFFDHRTEYIFGDLSPERVVFDGHSSLIGKYVRFYLLGLETTGEVWIPEADRLVKESGELDSTKLLTGRLMIESENETEIVGSVSSIIRVSENGAFALTMLGLLCMFFRLNFGVQSFRRKWLQLRL